MGFKDLKVIFLVLKTVIFCSTSNFFECFSEKEGFSPPMIIISSSLMANVKRLEILLGRTMFTGLQIFRFVLNLSIESRYPYGPIPPNTNI